MNFLDKYKHILLPILIVLISILGLSIRLTLLNTGDFWLDEAFTGIFVRANWNEMFRMIIIDLVHPPLYYSLLKLWTEMFSSTSVQTIRYFSLVWGVALIPLTYLFMDKLLEGSKRYISILTALTFAVNPFFISYSIEARAYSMLAVLGIVNAMFFLDILRSKKIERNVYIYFVLTSILLVSTHYISTIYLLSLGLLYLISKTKTLNFKNIYQSILQILKLFTPALLTVITILTSFYFIRGSILGSLGYSTSNNAWIPQIDILNLPVTVYNFLFGVQSQTMGVPPSNTFTVDFLKPEITGGVIFILLLLGILLVLRVRETRLNILFLLSISIFPILLVMLLSVIGVEMYIERYMIIFGVGLLLLTMYLLSYTGRYIPFLIVTLYLLLLSFISTPTANTAYSDICRSINGSTVLVDDPSSYILTQYYCNESSILLFTDNKEFYREYWLVVGYERVVDRLPRNITYIISTQGRITEDMISENQVLIDISK